MAIIGMHNSTLNDIENEEENLLNLKLLTELNNILKDRQNVEDFREDNLEFNSKKYCFSKVGNTLTVERSDGFLMEISVSRTANNPFVSIIKYKFISGNGLEMEIDYNHVSRAFAVADLNKAYIGIDYYYYSKKDNKRFYSFWNPKENRFNIKCGLERLDNGYRYYYGNNKYTVSKDLEKIISIDDKILPSIEELKKFNLKEEEEKLNNILTNYKFNEFNELSKELILEAIDNFKKDLKNKEKFAAKIIDAYENSMIPEIKKRLELENKMNDDTINNTFSREELLFIIEVMKERSKAYEFRINKIIDSLSLEEIKILKNKLESISNVDAKTKRK